MNDALGVHVTLAPRSPKAIVLSAPDLRTALEQVRARHEAGEGRMAVWTDAPAPEDGPDVVVCVPVAPFQSSRAQAEQVVAEWDARWLLIESMPRRHREAAHQHLVDLVSAALLAAALEGIFPLGWDEELGF